MQSINVDNEVYKELQRQAVPFVDTPNTVLRRLLGLDAEDQSHEGDQVSILEEPSALARSQPALRRPSVTRSRAKAKGKAKEFRTRAPSGALLPEDRYETPLLIALAERGGSASSREVIAAVGEKLKDELRPMDRQALQSGGIRWQSRVQFVRLRLIERGLVAKDTPRGTWGLTDTGIRAAKEASK